MSKIQETIDYYKRVNVDLCLNGIIENSSIRDIKDYISELQEKLKSKEDQVKELIIENVKLWMIYLKSMEQIFILLWPKT